MDLGWKSLFVLYIIDTHSWNGISTRKSMLKLQRNKFQKIKIWCAHQETCGKVCWILWIVTKKSVSTMTFEEQCCQYVGFTT